MMIFFSVRIADFLEEVLVEETVDDVQKGFLLNLIDPLVEIFCALLF